MDVDISRSRVGGRARAPPSKSYTHRAILAAGYSDGAVVADPLVSADTRATMRAVEAFGGHVDRDERRLDVAGFDGRPGVPDDVIDCANSGTTTRIVTACAALADGLTVLTGDDSLRSRPQGPLLDAIQQLDGRAESTRGNGQAPLVIGGHVDGGAVSIPGDVSSQYITALLMAGAVTDEGIDIDLETELKSAPYVDITLEVLDAFGVDAAETSDGYRVPGGQSYGRDEAYPVPGDFSSMSYLLAAGAVAGDDDGVVVEGAYPSAQGDSAIVDVLERMGADIAWDRDAGEITVRRSALSGVEVDVGDTPDLLPTIAVLGAVADGDTRIVNCEHVRYKETDRVRAMATELEKLGGAVTEEEDVLTIHGGESDLRGAAVAGHDDHRIVMSLAVAGLVAEGTTTIEGADHVDVSFPGFFDVLYDLGVELDEHER
ncbi:3-phosphoshikimate 1-carboxyvinyltransferase [Haloplanus aerogenes]|uniref:3-phosphoshikimate 1-carboxyvinyltransferase n=1 Tax=Haloplanus aerogenes TaxID=660522 RepID=A0A3G8QRD4_9EURY|nr:3-phosphoshikimate 1-carboxyvinyltransferase [Haloplanus aerogenes]AZH25026.1 3-phosphoshikimate 1-carboxyvinyltransferase [Haloplanus aerogenes]RMB13756.1 3-phosphoshikimate 1-carboxyvinyltransferase [Haloplanus aerogenes]